MRGIASTDPAAVRGLWSFAPRLLALLAVAALALAGPDASADVARVPRILVLASDPHTAPGLVELELSIRRTVADAFGDRVQIEFEHLDFVYNVSPEYRKAVVDLLRSKRAGHTSDVVITVGAGALRFAMDEKASLFPDAPIVFGWITSEDLAALGPNKPATGVVTEWGFGKELETALRILPRTRRAVIILGNGLFEKRYEPAFRREIEPLRNRVELDWWVGAPMAELESRIAQLPPHTVVIYIAIYRDAAGNNFIPMLAFERLARRSNAPLFAVLSHWVGRGAVGDGRIDISSIGTQVGEMTVRILRANRPRRSASSRTGPPHRRSTRASSTNGTSRGGCFQPAVA